MNLKIYLFRHGQTTYNRDKKFTGFHNPGLTNLGKKQAQKIAKILKNRKFQVAFYTRLKRSKQTLKKVLKYHPECKTLIKDDRMIERGYGKLQGLSHDKIIKKYGNEQFEIWHRSFYVPPPKGESFAMVETRVASFIKFLKIYMKKNKINVAISAHGNSIRLFRKIMEKSSIRETTSWFIPYDKVFVYNLRV
ncbi:2,3-bisphosphoglycerate-dependent phosphoglycerate mutase [Candidatus Pacearchaeota archaeon]|nr:2,3-bisphosphoglycerate-dependent phosphoglycerate mutase [Candidatus Pacearchaeota archaeon]